MSDSPVLPDNSQTPDRDWLIDPDIMVFESDEIIPEGGYVQHGFTDNLAGLFGRKKEDVKADWVKVQSQIQFLLDGVAATTKGYELDEIEFELGFGAEGSIVFIAKASVTTSFRATFRRRPPAAADVGIQGKQ